MDVRFHIEIIEWVDSAGFSHDGPWIPENEMDRQLEQHGVLKCRSVGYVIRETDEYVVISSTCTPGMFLDPMTIPKAAILVREGGPKQQGGD